MNITHQSVSQTDWQHADDSWNKSSRITVLGTKTKASAMIPEVITASSAISSTLLLDAAVSGAFIDGVGKKPAA